MFRGGVLTSGRYPTTTNRSATATPKVGSSLAKASSKKEEVPESLGGEKVPVKLDRFLKAQTGKNHCTPYSTALAEIRAGKKMSCWIWYVMPQLKDPARLSMRNEEFQIYNRLEAASFLREKDLRRNYLQLLLEIYEHLYTPAVAQVLEVEQGMAKERDGSFFNQLDYPEALAELRKRLAAENSNINAKVMRRSPPPVFGRGTEMHIGRLMSTMVDAKKAYHSISTFALAAVESIDSYLVVSFFANLLDIIVVSLGIACSSSVGVGKGTSKLAVVDSSRRSTTTLTTTDSDNIQFPKENQGRDEGFPLAQGHPLRELFLYGSETLAGMVRDGHCTAIAAKTVIAGKRIVAKVDPMIFGRWTAELPPMSLAKGSAMFSQELLDQPHLFQQQEQGINAPRLNQGEGSTSSSSLGPPSDGKCLDSPKDRMESKAEQQDSKISTSNQQLVPTTRGASDHKASVMLTPEEYEVL